MRFDPCYYVGYECNLRRLEEYQNLSNDLRELYQTPSIAEACDIAGMKRGVFSKAGRWFERDRPDRSPGRLRAPA